MRGRIDPLRCRFGSLGHGNLENGSQKRPKDEILTPFSIFQFSSAAGRKKVDGMQPAGGITQNKTPMPVEEGEE